MDGERADSDVVPPALGEHTAEVLATIGIDTNDVDRLRAAKVIA